MRAGARGSPLAGARAKRLAKFGPRHASNIMNRRESGSNDLRMADQLQEAIVPSPLLLMAETVESILHRYASGEPVTGSTCPVIQEAYSEAKNSTACAMSSGVPMRRTAIRWANRWRNASE